LKPPGRHTSVELSYDEEEEEEDEEEEEFFHHYRYKNDLKRHAMSADNMFDVVFTIIYACLNR